MLTTLSRWYGYEFHLADTTLARQYVSAGFPTDRVADAMNTLKAVLGVTMTFDGKVVTLQRERTVDSPSKRTSTHEFLNHTDSEVGK